VHKRTHTPKKHNRYKSMGYRKVTAPRAQKVGITKTHLLSLGHPPAKRVPSLSFRGCF